MGEYVLDHIEAGERAHEDWATDNIQGDRFRCPGCGHWKPLSEAEPSSPHPYATPICRGCNDYQQCPACGGMLEEAGGFYCLDCGYTGVTTVGEGMQDG